MPADWPDDIRPGRTRRQKRSRRRKWWGGGGLGLAAVVVAAIVVGPSKTGSTPDLAGADGNLVATITSSQKVPTSGPTSKTSQVATATAAGTAADPTAAPEAEPIGPALEPALVVADGRAATEALVMLDRIPVKGRAPKTGYSRDEFGPSWSDDVTVAGGHNGCDTRNDILRRDLTNVVIKAGSTGCVVLKGVLQDPYTGQPIAFSRGASTSSAVQIDHVVALSDAWQKGAQSWDPDQRRNFANDPRNLQAADGPSNQRKGASDAATWLPPAKSFRCTYVARQVQVKAAYGLWMTVAEKAAVQDILINCGGEAPAAVESSRPVATRSAVVPTPTRKPATSTVPTTSTPAPEPTPDPVVTTERAQVPAANNGPFANCTAVRAAGRAPIYAGEPGFESKFDRDNDGIGCES